MTYYMKYDITIGEYKVQTLKSVSVKKSVEQLCDTAIITLPGTLINEALEVNDKIKVGDPVRIEFGYDGYMNEEFTGYVKKINTDDADITIECEDELYLWEVMMKDEELHSKSCKSIIQHIAKQVSSKTGTNYKVECDYDFSYKDFTISHATAVDVLRKIQGECKAYVYFDGNTLHMHPQYGKGSWSGELVKYDMAINVISTELKYVRATDQKVKVELEFTGKDGKTYKGSAGVEGGKVIKRVISSDDVGALKRVAENEYNLWCYDGYEGSLTGWLIPYCKPTDYIEIRDKSKLFKTGRYYVVATDVTFSSGGGRRKVTIGRKMG